MKRKSVAGPLFVVLGSILAGAAVGLLMLRLPGTALPPGLPAWGAVAIVAGLYLVYVTVHEAGHVAAAMLVGFRPIVFVVGPVRLDRTAGRTILSLNRSLSLAGGLAICLPVGTQALRQRMMVMTAGGPVASLMFGVQCLAVWVAASGALARGGPAGAVAGFTLLTGGILSLSLGVITLVPMRAGGFSSDGARIVQLMRNDADTQREIALLALTGASSVQQLQPHESENDEGAECPGQPVEVRVDEALDRRAVEVDEAGLDEEAQAAGNRTRDEEDRERDREDAR